ncbi:hypothetical protein N656DRAFT_164415 [Canariomyces notabilis]|uniref:Uncharacterized protein n=1 Tax=Canariomyces notabilis TaxID=2074819 RepID=A0AAN6TBT2_9PEZI|nr:hypothetical protein N656DRAFT_164415 [Canariomyces arenarius]
MRAGAIAIRALLGGSLHVATEHRVTQLGTSPNPGAGLLARQGTCDPGWVLCVDGCMPAGSVCCTSRGTYCDAGYYCMTTSGCCREGRTCSGVATCDPGEVFCNNGCIPQDGVCCPSGGYCDPGEVCTSDGFCRQGSGGSSGGSTTRATSTVRTTATTTRSTSSRATSTSRSATSTSRRTTTSDGDDDNVLPTTIPNEFPDATESASGFNARTTSTSPIPNGGGGSSPSITLPGLPGQNGNAGTALTAERALVGVVAAAAGLFGLV